LVTFACSIEGAICIFPIEYTEVAAALLANTALNRSQKFRIPAVLRGEPTATEKEDLRQIQSAVHLSLETDSDGPRANLHYFDNSHRETATPLSPEYASSSAVALMTT
jgi:hypothetical protein